MFLVRHTTKPWSFMLRMKFWPMTARPIRAMSALEKEKEKRKKEKKENR